MLQKGVAVITGASRGIGRTIATRLAAEGMIIVINYMKSEIKAKEVVHTVVHTIEASGGQAIAVKADVSGKAGADKLLSTVEGMTDNLVCLVNNVGIIRDQLTASMRLEDWDEVIQVNLRSIFLVTQRFIPMFMVAGGGSIINISSIAATVGGKGQGNYAASKGGVEAFTRALAVELAPKRIRVNAVAPGYIETDMSQEVRNNPETVRNIPMRRYGRPEEVAEVVAFLASSKASYVSGAVVKVAGGIN